MATSTQRKIEDLRDKISELSNALWELEDEVGDLTAMKSDEDISPTEKLEYGGWVFTKVDAASALDMLEEIGLRHDRRYSLTQVTEIRLAVERILR